MAYSVDVPSESRDWVVATRHAEGASVVMEMLPADVDPHEWEELITNLAILGSDLDTYVESWLSMQSQSGAIVSGDETAPDGARIISYTSPDESAIWKFTEGLDGVYGISYQSRSPTPLSQDWSRRIRAAKLLEVREQEHKPTPHPDALGGS